MFLFHPKKVPTQIQVQMFVKIVRKDSPEIIAAKEYLNKTHPTLLPRASTTLFTEPPFNYVGYSKKDSYKRYQFIEGSDTRIIYIVLCDEERDKVIKLFTDKMKEMVENYQEEFIYKDSLKGMFVGKNVKHRFFSNRHRAVAIMTDDGKIEFQPIPGSEDMD